MSTTFAGGGPKEAWAPTPSPGEPVNRRFLTSMVGLAALLPMLCAIIWLLATFRFSSLMVLVVVGIILVNLVKFAAGFSGRKTTTMADPNKTDHWHR